MNDLVKRINGLKKTDKKFFDKKKKEFLYFRSKKATNNEVFLELCFCLMAANFNAKRSLLMQEKIGVKFMTLDSAGVAGELKKYGHRFPNMRAKFIYEASRYKDEIKATIEYIEKEEGQVGVREWLVKNIKGLGFKAASHFMRNIGYFDVAIIDFHIIDILADNGMIVKPQNNTLNKQLYLDVEKVLAKLGKKVSLTQGELDMYLWYLETGNVYK